MIIFDLDGTLWDSADHVTQSWNLALSEAGVSERVTTAQMKSFMGRPVSVIFDELLAAHDEPTRRRLQTACCERENAYLCEVGGTLFPALKETLTALSARYPLAIVSNCQAGYIEAFLAFTGLSDLFADTECFGGTGEGKAANIRRVMARCGCEKALYVGDTAADAAAAQEAGVTFVHAAYGFGKVSNTAQIRSLAELAVRADALIAGVPFYPADILLPPADHGRWAVIACDQFTSEPAYWEEADRLVGDAPSALRLVFPEVYLADQPDRRIAEINRTMSEYLDRDLLVSYPDSLFYIERTLPDGSVRQGLVGMIDLETYGIDPHTEAPIRATEGMIPSRIPPRVAIRKDAPLELPHVMLLMDDPRHAVFSSLSAGDLPLVYDTDLSQGGGHIRGFRIPADRQAAVYEALGTLVHGEHPMVFAVGDGNHSLVTAKTCYEQYPNEKNRYSLVEVVNIHDRSLDFEPIYRVLFHVDVPTVLADLQAAFDRQNGTEAPQTIDWVAGNESGTITISHPQRHLTIGTLQAFLDEYLPAHPEIEVDYIHGVEAVRALASKENTLGLLFDGIEKSDLFPAISKDGVLPRKTFSMGEAQSKRYYMEARKIR